MAGMLVTAFGILSCSNDDLVKGTPLKPGTEINFGPRLAPTSDIQTRTYYGDPSTANGKTVWPIFWNAAPNNDHIFIYSPQAISGRNQASYTVVRNDQRLNEAADITKDRDCGVQAGASSSGYEFYALYPASAVIGESTGNSITATLSPAQSVTFAGTKNNPSAVQPGAATVGEIEYLTKPDMNCCLMTASEKVATLTDEPVVLNFKPFSSVLDITITGPTDNNTITDRSVAAVTSVEVVADANIAGDFTYDFSKQSFTFGKNGTNSITISTLASDAGGNMSGVVLANQNKLKIQAFILPNKDVKDLNIIVHTSDNQKWNKKLTMDKFSPKKIHPVKLPPLKFAEAEFDYSVWLSQLDPRIYISEISLPGSCSSSSFRSTGDAQVQTLDLTNQFNSGVRVFQSHAWLYSGTSKVDNQDTHIGLNTLGGTEVVSLYEAVTNLQKEMNENHGNEFCVLMLSDYQHKGTYDQSQFQKRLKVVVNKLVADGIVAGNITPNTTLADVKGKIILKYQLNGDGGCEKDGDVYRKIQAGGSEGTSGTNAFLKKIQGWSELDGADVLFNWWSRKATNTLFYASMEFGKIGSFAIQTEFGNESVKASIKDATPGLATDAANMLLMSADYVWLAGGWYGNINPTSEPTKNFNNTTNMWLMYAEQSDGNKYYSDAKDNITQVVNSIKPTYKSEFHNKFYLTYAGAVGGGSHSTETIATEFATAWSEAVGTNKEWGNYPMGWVMFNRVLLPTKENKDNVVVQAIQKVISQNNDADYKLNRDKNQDVTPQFAPSGDVDGTKPGDPIF